MQGHGFGIAEGQHQPGTFAVFRADRAKDIGGFRPLILRGRRPGSAPRPAPGNLVFLADARLILEPYLYGCALREGLCDDSYVGRLTTNEMAGS
jgi:hypothetical protein